MKMSGVGYATMLLFAVLLPVSCPVAQENTIATKAQGVSVSHPPSCKVEERDGKVFDVCTRVDTKCLDIVKAEVANPSDKWNGCLWGATIIKGTLALAGMVVYSTHVSVVCSYIDSERVDMTITVEFTDHTHRDYVRSDIPVIIRDGVPTASVDISTPNEPLGVPTVEATEKGGAKKVAHSYK